jgi:hypothetical protein
MTADPISPLLTAPPAFLEDLEEAARTDADLVAVPRDHLRALLGRLEAFEVAHLAALDRAARDGAPLRPVRDAQAVPDALRAAEAGVT